jgi:hypothetical protein
MKKIQIFLLFTIISFFFFLAIIFFSPGSKKIITVYEIRDNYVDGNINLNTFENFFDFNLANNEKNKSKFEDFYTHVTLNYNDNIYRGSLNKITNFHELFNKSLKNKLKINSFNSQTSLKSYSYRNIPEKIYEVKIISNNAEDAQKFFEKYIKEVANEVNLQILKELYVNYITYEIKDIKLDQSFLLNQIEGFKNCKNILNSELSYLLKTDSRLSNDCGYMYNLILFNNKIADLENTYNSNNAKIINRKSLRDLSEIKTTDFFYRSFIKIAKKENIDNISSLNAFILYLFSLVFVWILIFKINYFTVLRKNKLFKLPK